MPGVYLRWVRAKRPLAMVEQIARRPQVRFAYDLYPPAVVLPRSFTTRRSKLPPM